MGGMHPSIVPDDARPHCDSLCLGEVEGVWDDILCDLRAGALAPTYGPRTPQRWVRPMRGLFDDRGDGYDWKPSLFSLARGCPRPCLYCNIPILQRGALRLREIDDVIDELRGLEGRDIYLTEDVIMFRASSIEAYTIALFDRIAELDVHVFMTSALVFNTRPRFLDALARGHTRANYVTLGFDPISRGVYAGDPKMIEATRRQVDAMQERGIRFHAAFGVGFDDDDPGVFDRILRFCEDAGIVTAEFFIATPFPGTPLYRQLAREGRLIHRRWVEYNGGHVVFAPRKMTAAQLSDGFLQLWTEHYRGQDVQRVLSPFDHVARAPDLPRA